MPARLCFTALPEVVHTAVLGFLAAWDVGSVLQLFKGVRVAVGPAIHSLQLPGNGTGVALVRLLRLCTNLQRLTIDVKFTGKLRQNQQALAEAIRDGSICSSLQSLRLGPGDV